MMAPMRRRGSLDTTRHSHCIRGRRSNVSANKFMLEQTYPYVETNTSGPALHSLFGIRASDGADTASAAPIKPKAIAQKPPASVVMTLLDRAAETIDNDRAAARDCITRASALLQAENERVKFARGGLAPWQMLQVTRHIDGALASTIRTRDCAKIVRLSTCYFSRAFKVSFGETFSRYVARRRTERAQELMMMTDDPLCQIALCCGFADQSHFSRVYHRQVGASPASWRRQRRREPLMHEDLMPTARIP